MSTASAGPRRSVSGVLRERGRDSKGAVVGYLPVGFPDLATSIEAAVALAENGFDIIELGLPYSDPVMDGPVIQRATQAALAAGFRVSQAFDAVASITERTGVPVVLMTYWNLVLQYGVQRFSEQLAAAGGAGAITPDLIPDEASEWLAAARANGLDHIFLAAPSSTDERLASVVRQSSGFVYAVSTMGITGARSDVDAAARSLVSRLRDQGGSEVCVGLGISTAAQVSEVLEYADGAIIGSALISALAEGGVRGLASAAATLSSGTRLS